MEIFLGISALLFVLVSLILPWTQRARINALTREVEYLRTLVGGGRVAQEAVKPAAATSTPLPPPPPARHYAPPPTKTPTPSKPAKKRISFEQQFGARLPVWAGGIALALAGVFMVKYSIEEGLLSPAIRLTLGGLFGLALVGASAWLRPKQGVADSTRIAQALAGAGLADLYVCLFAASQLYHLIPSLIAFAGMAAVTASAVVLALRHGAPIAVLGMAGGFLTPLLLGSADPDAPLLFLYLYCVVAGFFVIIRREGWWWMSLPLVLAAFGWVTLWLLTGFTSGDALWLGLFLLAVCATMVASTRRAMEAGTLGVVGKMSVAAALNYLTLGGAAVLMFAIARHAQFGLLEWGLFGLLSAGGLFLAYFNQRLYGFVPWLTMAVNALMLAAWHGAEPSTYAFVLLCYATLYAAGGYALMWRALNAFSFAMLSAMAALVYYLLAYVGLSDWLASEETLEAHHALAQLPLWGIIALVLALAGADACRRILSHYAGEEKMRQKLLAVFAIAATAFLSLGLTIELKREFLSVAFAAEVLAVSWIVTRVRINALRRIAGGLTVVFGAVLLPQILLLAQLTVYSLTEITLPLQDALPMVKWPLFQLGLPAAMFAVASVLLRKGRDDALVRALEVAAIALTGIMGYYLVRHAMHPEENVLFIKAGFTERGIITNALFAYGVACLWMARRFDRPAIMTSGFVLAAIGALRILWFDLVLYNPLWEAQAVRGVTLFNTLLLPFGLPAVWLYFVQRELVRAGYSRALRFAAPFQLLLVFTLLSLNVRQFYHGEMLSAGETSNAEIYTYSVVWLLLGIALLCAGTLRKEKMLRVASLAVMILSVGKVFLYDASALTGLLRVFSFLGLGFSLLALSWFYTRFVFAEKN